MFDSVGSVGRRIGEGSASLWRFINSHANAFQVVLTLVAIGSTILLSYVGFSVARDTNSLARRQIDLMFVEQSPVISVDKGSSVVDGTSRTTISIINSGRPVYSFTSRVASYLTLCSVVAVRESPFWSLFYAAPDEISAIALADRSFSYSPTGSIQGELGRWEELPPLANQGISAELERLIGEYLTLDSDMGQIPCISHYVTVWYVNLEGVPHYESFLIRADGTVSREAFDDAYDVFQSSCIDRAGPSPYKRLGDLSAEQIWDILGELPPEN